MFHKPHQARYTEAGSAGHKMANPVVANIESLEEASHAQHGPYNLDPSVDWKNHVAYPIGETEKRRPVLRCPCPWLAKTSASRSSPETESAAMVPPI